MAVMLKAYNRHTCPYGRKCCDYEFRGKRHGAKSIRRNVRHKEKRLWQRELRDEF